MKTRNSTLLIVDDDADQLFLFTHTFEKMRTRYTVQLAASGEEAVSYLTALGPFADRQQFQFPTYILTDQRMHPGDGFAILEFLRTNPALSVVPVIVLSSSDDCDDIRRAYLLGASSYFIKPLDLLGLGELLRSIREYWTQCEVPQVDIHGNALPTHSAGKHGARYAPPGD